MTQPTLYDNAEHLARVRWRLATTIVRFWRERLAGERRFHMVELVSYVAAEFEAAPDSPGRILRDLRQGGCVNYRVVNRKESLYEVLPV